MSEEYAIIAELPLGVFRGRLSDGGTDPVPAPARLHGALLNAAALGPRAIVSGTDLAPRDEDVAALRWLETHPPTGVRLPRTRTGGGARLTVYREEGTMRQEGRAAGPSPKKTGKPFTGVVAVDGPFAWTWQDPPPRDVADCFAALVGDVSHLGTSESPARLRIGRIRPTHRQSTASLFDASPGGHDLDVADEGRTDALMTRFAAERTAPTLARDRYATSEAPLSRPGWGERRRTVRYVPEDVEEVAPGPWDVVMCAPLSGGPLVDAEKVAFAVGVHRALIRFVGDGAPAILTGNYPPGSPTPANRVGLHVLDAGPSATAGLSDARQHLLVMVPRGTHPLDLTVVSTALGALRRVRGRSIGPAVVRAGATFWPAPRPGARTLWMTSPAAVPETRAPRADPSWTLERVVQLALALVHRDDADLVPAVEGRGQVRYAQLADHLAAAGVSVPSADFLRINDVSRYVHKIPERGVVRPYVAAVDLGLLPARTLLAIGQTRHLGGGLLVPADEEVR